MRPIGRIVQQDDWGCGIAVLAMLTDDSYVNVKTNIEADPWAQKAGDWKASGISQLHLEKYLSERGWYFRRVYSSWQSNGVWPPAPFAERHYAIVQQPSGNGHFVVMCADGMVLDPMAEVPKTLADWKVVNLVVGLRGDIQ